MHSVLQVAPKEINVRSLDSDESTDDDLGIDERKPMAIHLPGCAHAVSSNSQVGVSVMIMT